MPRSASLCTVLPCAALILLALLAPVQAKADGLPTDASANYTAVDPPITAQQFSDDIARVKTIDWSPFSWQAADDPSSTSGTFMQTQSTALGLASQLTTGSASLNANNVPPQPGYSILGVPHAQTLYHATILAGKVVNGVQQDAICYFEIFTGTPQATRYIKYGVAFSCNQPWIHGRIAAGLGSINDPNNANDTTVGEYPLGTTDAPYVENGFVYYGLVSTTAYYSRTFEQQLENIYGYLDLYVDNPGPNDNFLGQPGGAGAYDSYNCAGANTPHVICQIVTAPFTFVPTDDTQCVNGDACGTVASAPQTVNNEIASTENTATGAVNTATSTATSVENTATSTAGSVQQQLTDTALADSTPPTFTNNFPTTWINDPNTQLSVTANDDKTGIAKFSIAARGFAWDGAKSATDCPTPRCSTSSVLVSPIGNLPDGASSIYASATDAAGNQATSADDGTWQVKIDRTAPTEGVSGGLVDAAGEIFTGTTYDLAVDATDAMSGVASVEVSVDGSRVAQGAQTQNPADGHGLSYDWEFDPAQYTVGAHTVDIRAVDAAGNTVDQTMAVTVDDVSAADLGASHGSATADDAAVTPADLATTPTVDNLSDPPATLTGETYEPTCSDGVADGATSDCNVDTDTNALDSAIRNEGSLLSGVLTTPLVGDFAPGANQDDDYGMPARSADSPIASYATSGPLTRGGSGWGISDLKPGMWDDTTDLDPLSIGRARLVVPWDVVIRGRRTSARTYTTYDGTAIPVGPDPASLKTVDLWIHKALPCKSAVRAEVLVSFERSKPATNLDPVRKVLPTAAEYEQGVRAFLDRYKHRCRGHRRIRLFTAWNEPNYGKQPTHVNPSGLVRAGVYWNRLNHLCKSRDGNNRLVYNCTVAAGDFADDQTLFPAIEPYKRGMSYGPHKPAAWALHPYRTMHLTNAGAQTRVQRFLAAIGDGPKLWLTEAGGRVYQYGSKRAKTDLCNLMSFRSFSDRITRIYQYELYGPPVHDADGKDPHAPVFQDNFDSALVQNDYDSNKLERRPLYSVFQYYSAATGTNPC